MPVDSLEGLLVALFLIVPGGLGVALRRNLFSAQPTSAFNEFLNALAATFIAALLIELGGMLAPGDGGVGDFLFVPLTTASDEPRQLNWGPYFVFLALALIVPTGGAWLRRHRPIRSLMGSLSPHSSGLDYLFREALPADRRGGEVWVTVNMNSGEAFLGQLMWRSTDPDPLEIVLARVRDLNDDSEKGQQEDWSVWLPGSSIRALWVHLPETAAT